MIARNVYYRRRLGMTSVLAILLIISLSIHGNQARGLWSICSTSIYERSASVTCYFSVDLSKLSRIYVERYSYKHSDHSPESVLECYLKEYRCSNLTADSGVTVTDIISNKFEITIGNPTSQHEGRYHCYVPAATEESKEYYKLCKLKIKDSRPEAPPSHTASSRSPDSMSSGHADGNLQSAFIAIGILFVVAACVTLIVVFFRFRRLHHKRPQHGESRVMLKA